MLAKLRRIIEEVSASEDLATAMLLVVSNVRSIIDTQACSIYLLNKNTNNYQLVASDGFKNDNKYKLEIAKDEGLVGLVGIRGEPINLENAQQHPNYLYFPETGEEKFRAFLGAPITHQRKILGVIVLQQKESRKFDEDEEALLVTVATQLASKIANAKTATVNRIFDGHDNDSNIGQKTLSGFAVSPGVNAGKILVVYPQADFDAVLHKEADNIENEILLFQNALNSTNEELEQLYNKFSKILPSEESAIFIAYKQMISKNSLSGEVEDLINSGLSAQYALKKVILGHLRVFSEMEDVYLQSRATDIKDLGLRILNHLQKDELEKKTYYPDTVVAGEEITASLLADIPVENLKGIISSQGSKNSHVAILARAIGVPVVMGVEGLNLANDDGREVIIDGYNGKLYISPDIRLKKEFKRLIEEDKALYTSLAKLMFKPAQTTDGSVVSMQLNIGLAAEAASSFNDGADGVGLYRTEMPFLVRERFPTEEEQRQIYEGILSGYAPKSVTMRTLDIGGDKSLPYFPIEEENPFLGWRGIRITLDHPELFLVQARAMLRANVNTGNLKIMLPMVSNIEEIIEAKRLLTQAFNELCAEGANVLMPQVGVMLEVPSTIFQIKAIAEYADFVSIGTNDLTQYLLAVDRNNKMVANLYDSLHPAVLQALIKIIDESHAVNLSVSLCGEMASDPAAAILLLAMGIDILSLNASSLLPIKWVIRSFSLQEAKSLLAKALQKRSSAEIRAIMVDALDKAGLGGLIRAGK